jgi:succinylarginine dihydrolase
MRLTRAHGEPGVEIFVYGRSGGRFPARQHEQAGRIVARRHGLDPARVIYLEQSAEAIAAGAFHNDVVAVANERVLFAHEKAFAEPDAAYAAIRKAFPEVEIVVVPDIAVSLAEAVRSYLFNAQLVTVPTGEQALVIPLEAGDSAPVRQFLDAMMAGNGPIRRVVPVDVRQSMANGGGPACLRLRVAADPATVDPRFLLDEPKAAAIEGVVERHWPAQIDPDDLGSETLAGTVRAARTALLDLLELNELG